MQNDHLKSVFGKGVAGALQITRDTLITYSQKTVDLLMTDKFQAAFESLQIKDRYSQQRSLIRYPEQEELWQYILWCRENKVPVRAIILKARQLGFSTFILGLFWLICVMRPYTEAYSASFEDQSAVKLFKKVHFYWEKMPEELKAGKVLEKETTHDLWFGPPHHSSFTSATAKNQFLASSQTIQLLHLSEFAKWPMSTAFDTFVSITSCVPTNDPESMIFNESTAYGVNLFKDMWDEARSGESVFKPFFFSWKKFPEYYFYFTDENKPKFTKEALQLQKDAGVCDYQLAWAQQTCKEKCLNDWNYFHQENPYSEQVAFRYTGQAWFSAAGIEEAFKHVMEPTFRGELRWTSTNKPIVEFVEYPEGLVEIWQKPLPGRKYIWAADICAGIGGDYFVLSVYLVPEKLMESLEQVAKVRSNRIGSREAAEICFQMGVYYNWAWGANEVNNMGIDTANDLEHGHKGTQTDGGYPALYHHTVIDKTTREETKRVGWLTTSSTKFFMLQKLQSCVNEFDITLRSRRTVLELEGFGYDQEKKDWVSMYKDDKTKKRHDDEVMQTAIAYQMYLNRPDTADFEDVPWQQ